MPGGRPAMRWTWAAVRWELPVTSTLRTANASDRYSSDTAGDERSRGAPRAPPTTSLLCGPSPGESLLALVALGASRTSARPPSAARASRPAGFARPPACRGPADPGSASRSSPAPLGRVTPRPLERGRLPGTAMRRAAAARLRGRRGRRAPDVPGLVAADVDGPTLPRTSRGSGSPVGARRHGPVSPPPRSPA